MARQMKQWYHSMNQLYVDNKLKKHPELTTKYGAKYSSFRGFCIIVMENFGWQNIESIQNEFDNENFYELHFKRMHEKNIKRWKEISKEVFIRDAYTCAYCGDVGGILEVDHVIPFSKGGSDELDNLVCSCRRCNRQKRDKTATEFEEWRKRNE